MRAPMIVSWMTTNQCNLKCAHCYQDAEEATDKELSTDEGKKMIDEIARAGFKVMIFSGGEPLMRPDIYELVAHAAENGLRPVFGSNGTLITPKVAVRLKEAGACAMGISVDSLDAGQARQVPRPAERPRPDHGRHRGVQAGGPAVPAAHHRGGLEPRRGLRHHRLCGGNWRHRALRVLPHPRRPRQVHPGDVASGAGERALARATS